jgi:AcrR family transcriptional regulator
MAPAFEVDPGGARASVLVADIQRARIVSAMICVAAESGVSAATVAPVLARAGLSRRTFYEFFECREDCLLAALDNSVDRVSALARSAWLSPQRWLDRVRASLVVILSFFDDEPAMARLLVVESLAAGPKALQRRNRVLESVVSALDEGKHERDSPLPPLTSEGVTGAVLSVIHTHLLEGNGSLIELAGPLMGMIALPYLGRSSASCELARPAAKALPVKPTSRTGGDPLHEVGMRLTHRTVSVLRALKVCQGCSNSMIAREAGIADQAQMSKLLRRLSGLGLVENVSAGLGRGTPNAWTLTEKGVRLERALDIQAGSGL